MQKYFSKKKFLTKLIAFIKESNLKHILKTRQINQKQKSIYLENQLKKYGLPPKKHHTIETFIETRNNEINEEIAHIKPPEYSNLSKVEQKSLEDLQERDDIVIVNGDKGGAVVILTRSINRDVARI